MAYNKKLYKTDDSVIDSSVIYDDTQKKLQSEINTSVTSSISSLNDSSNHAIKDNVAAQTISGSAASANLQIKNNASGAVKLVANNEGGNLRLEKGKMHVELDTNGMSADGTGFSRLYLNNNESSEIDKTFIFRQDGSFTDGNGVNTGTLNSTKVSKTGDTMTGLYQFKSSNLDKDVATDSWGNSYPVCVDKDGDFVGSVRGFTINTGVSGVQLTGQNGSYQNYLRLGETANHEHYVAVTDTNAWRKALGLCYAVNDVFSTSAGVSIPGIITSNSTIIYCSVSVDKSMENISTITVTSLSGWFAGPNGALNGSTSNVQYVGASGYTIGCRKVSNYIVRIEVTKSNAFTSSVNNSAIVFMGTITLKFT